MGRDRLLKMFKGAVEEFIPADDLGPTGVIYPTLTLEKDIITSDAIEVGDKFTLTLDTKVIETKDSAGENLVTFKIIGVSVKK